MFVAFECREGVAIREVSESMPTAVCDGRHNINLQKFEMKLQRLKAGHFDRFCGRPEGPP
jgi:hypothetical protein